MSQVLNDKTIRFPGEEDLGTRGMKGRNGERIRNSGFFCKEEVKKCDKCFIGHCG